MVKIQMEVLGVSNHEVFIKFLTKFRPNVVKISHEHLGETSMQTDDLFLLQIIKKTFALNLLIADSYL